jgi:uncharacterized membrane-anchored protein YhcB (DUF1043 family)
MKIDILLLLWLAMPVLFIGGLLIGRAYSPGGKRINSLKQEIRQTQADLDQTSSVLDQTQTALETAQGMSEEYRQQVTKHFSKTAELVNELTINYKAVYEHLATSAVNLCDEGAALLPDNGPGKRLLGKTPSIETNGEPPPESSDPSQR